MQKAVSYTLDIQAIEALDALAEHSRLKKSRYLYHALIHALELALESEKERAIKGVPGAEANVEKFTAILTKK